MKLPHRTRLCAALAAAALLAAVPAVAAPPLLRISHQIAVPGAATLDFLRVDSPSGRLYVAHGTQVEVLDLRSEKWIGRVNDTPGVRGITVAPDLGLGFTANSRANTVSVFDLTTFEVRQTVRVGSKPDAILHDPRTQRVLVFNNQSYDMSAIDAKTGDVIATLALDGEPEVAVFDARGRVHVNLESSDERIVIDPALLKVTARQRTLPCQRPVGLAIDAEAQQPRALPQAAGP